MRELHRGDVLPSTVQPPARAANNERIPVAMITVSRCEGPPDECVTETVRADPTATRTVWERADDVLRAWAQTAPPAERDYNKCRYTVTYADGREFSERYRLTQDTAREPAILAAEMTAYCHYYSGQHCPLWMDATEYERMVAGSPQHAAETGTLLRAYEIGDHVEHVQQRNEHAVGQETTSAHASTQNQQRAHDPIQVAARDYAAAWDAWLRGAGASPEDAAALAALDNLLDKQVALEVRKQEQAHVQVDHEQAVREGLTKAYKDMWNQLLGPNDAQAEVALQVIHTRLVPLEERHQQTWARHDLAQSHPQHNQRDRGNDLDLDR